MHSHSHRARASNAVVRCGSRRVGGWGRCGPCRTAPTPYSTLARRTEPDAPELLGTLPRVDLSGVDVPLRIDHEVVHPVELAGVPAVPAKARKNRARVAELNPDDVVLAVGAEQVRLPLVRREVQIPLGAVSARLRTDEELLDERPALREDLAAVVDAVADVDEPVIRDDDAVDGIAELTGSLRIPGRESVRAPVALVLPGVRVEHDDAVVPVPVSYIDLVRLLVDEHVGRLAKELRVRVAARQAGSADLQQELALRRELEHLVVGGSVARDPDVAVVVDEDAVLVRRPFVARAPDDRIHARGRHTRGRTAPRAKHVPVGVEFHHRRRPPAAHRTTEL